MLFLLVTAPPLVLETERQRVIFFTPGDVFTLLYVKTYTYLSFHERDIFVGYSMYVAAGCAAKTVYIDSIVYMFVYTL